MQRAGGRRCAHASKRFNTATTAATAGEAGTSALSGTPRTASASARTKPSRSARAGEAAQCARSARLLMRFAGALKEPADGASCGCEAAEARGARVGGGGMLMAAETTESSGGVARPLFRFWWSYDDRLRSLRSARRVTDVTWLHARARGGGMLSAVRAPLVARSRGFVSAQPVRRALVLTSHLLSSRATPRAARLLSSPAQAMASENNTTVVRPLCRCATSALLLCADADARRT